MATKKDIETVTDAVEAAAETVVEEVKKAAHFSNLQPLWAVENIAKYDTVPAEAAA